MNNPTAIRYCRQCDKPLHGRSDQIYCNDTCRNTYNKQKTRAHKIPPHPNQKAIFKAIQRNYEILKSLYPTRIRTGNHHSYVQSYIPKDFNREFYTGVEQDKEGLWFVCFDRGWMDGKEYLLVKDFPDKANMKTRKK